MNHFLEQETSISKQLVLDFFNSQGKDTLIKELSLAAFELVSQNKENQVEVLVEGLVDLTLSGKLELTLVLNLLEDLLEIANRQSVYVLFGFLEKLVPEPIVNYS